MYCCYYTSYCLSEPACKQGNSRGSSGASGAQTCERLGVCYLSGPHTLSQHRGQQLAARSAYSLAAHSTSRLQPEHEPAVSKPDSYSQCTSWTGLLPDVQIWFVTGQAYVLANEAPSPCVRCTGTGQTIESMLLGPEGPLEGLCWCGLVLPSRSGAKSSNTHTLHVR